MNVIYPTILSALEALGVTLVVVRKEDTVYVRSVLLSTKISTIGCDVAGVLSLLMQRY